jgi:hypothetical protein
MNMKKITVLLAMFLGTYGVANAQRFYLDFNMGYGFGFPTNVLGQSMSTDIVNGVKSNTSSNLQGSIGQGLNWQITPGYMITDNIGVELGINYFMGAKKTMAETSSTITTYTTDNDGNKTYKFEKEDFSRRKDVANSNQIRIAPAVIISTGASKAFSGYTKLGIIMPVFGSTTVNTDAVSAAVNGNTIDRTSIVAKTVISGAPSFGFKGALGLNYNITSNLSVFGEVYVMSLNVKQKERKTVSMKVNGVEEVSSSPLYSTDIKYVDQLTPESNNEDAVITGGLSADHDVTKPKQELFQKTSFSQLGIQFGVKYTFGGKK